MQKGGGAERKRYREAVQYREAVPRVVYTPPYTPLPYSPRVHLSPSTCGTAVSTAASSVSVVVNGSLGSNL